MEILAVDGSVPRPHHLVQPQDHLVGDEAAGLALTEDLHLQLLQELLDLSLAVLDPPAGGGRVVRGVVQGPDIQTLQVQSGLVVLRVNEDLSQGPRRLSDHRRLSAERRGVTSQCGEHYLDWIKQEAGIN